jgi:hypothetical protein
MLPIDSGGSYPPPVVVVLASPGDQGVGDNETCDNGTGKIDANEVKRGHFVKSFRPAYMNMNNPIMPISQLINLASALGVLNELTRPVKKRSNPSFS